MSPQKHVVFDVVGTCVSYQAFFEGVEKELGAKLIEAGLGPQLFAFAWMESAEREFTYLSVSERYIPYLTVMRSLFYRVLHMAGVKNPREFATDEQRDAMMKTYGELNPREGLRETFELLRGAGFTIWCLTTGDVSRVRGYFEKAGIDMPIKNFMSCDTKGIAKPALAAYEPALASLAKEDIKWFAAAHMWDVSAAKVVGFRGAYCTIYEKEPCAELFGGDMEVMADTLPEMAKAIIAASA